jgi:hypothetical protein
VPCSLRALECMADLVLSTENVIPDEKSLSVMQVYPLSPHLGTPQHSPRHPREYKTIGITVDQSRHAPLSGSKSQCGRGNDASTYTDVTE